VLPHAKLRTNTNGDFVTLDYIFELRDAGLNELFIQQYLANRELYNHDKLKQIMIKKLEKLGVDFSIISDIKNHRIEFDLKIPGITVHLRSRNFEFEGTTRTKIVSEFNKDYTRTSPCKQPFNNMYIDYNGTVMVCCNSRSDIAEHENGIMGSIYKNNLWDIYFSDRYNYWREHLKDESPKKGICKECKIDIKFEEFL
jgi:radical SAM protein with 4Fe4S-binding SPASM domain